MVERKGTRRPAAAVFDDLDDADAAALPALQHRDRRPQEVIRWGTVVVKPLTDPAAIAEEIGSLYRQTHDRFLGIGKYLLMAKALLTEHGEFEAWVDANLPFTHSTGQKLMAVAKAVDDGRIPIERMPQSYSAAYELVSLLPLLDRASIQEPRLGEIREELFRPEVPRNSIARVKRELRRKLEAATVIEHAPSQRRAIERRIGDLRRQRQRLDEELERLEAELARLDGDGKP